MRLYVIAELFVFGSSSSDAYIMREKRQNKKKEVSTFFM